MSIFKTKAEKYSEQQRRKAQREAEQRQREQQRKEQADLEARMDAIELFPGSLAEYNAMKGKEYEIVDMHRQEQYSFEDSDDDLLASLVRRDADAAIHYRIVDIMAMNYSVMGVPVRLKRYDDHTEITPYSPS